ncbi:MAG TPA: hypothetical protein V6C71_26545 [Coleofasciculaceae cyanobacterium]
MGYGFLGVVIFSLTLPATCVAVTELNPAFVGLGRAIIPAGLGAILLIITRQPIPPKRCLPRFMMVAAGVIIGFPLLTAIAMDKAPASMEQLLSDFCPLLLLCLVFGAVRNRFLALSGFLPRSQMG